MPAQEGFEAANARFDGRFAAGMTALRAGETSKAWRAFSRCRELAQQVAPERRPAAAFAADLCLAETTMIVGQVEAVSVHAMLLELVNAANASGAWTQPGCEWFRLRALVLRWRTAPLGGFRRDLPDADREWLLRDDFFAIAPERLADMHDVARVLRFKLAQGTALELPMLRELVRAEARAGPEWRSTMSAALASYHAERRSFDRARIYAERMPAEESKVLRALLALQREDHAAAEALARELVAAGDAAGEQLLAEVLEVRGRYAEALPHYDAVLAHATDAGTRAAAQNGRGDCLLGLGRFDEARAAYDAALAACDDDTVGLIGESAETIKDLGRLAERRGDRTRAFAQYRFALAIGESARERLLDDAFGGSWLRVHADQATAVDGMLRTCPKGPVGWEVVRALELARGRGALDLASRGRTDLDAASFQTLVRRRLRATDAAEIDAIAAEIDALRVQAEIGRAGAAVPSTAELLRFAQRHRDAAMLTWWLGREQAWLLVIRGGAVTRFELGAADQCRAQAAAAWRAVATPAGDPAALAGAADMLLPLAARDLLTDVVVAIVDPAMARLPVAALTIGGEPLGVTRAVVQVPSLAVARLLDRRRPTGSGRLVVEAPEATSLTNRLGLDPLVFAARECEAVRAAWGEAVHLRGEAATFAGVASRTPDLLHVAAHAIDCPGLPTQSVLLLADGPHAMGSLGGLDLPGTFVVLSACAAATGEQRGREGVVGLVEGVLGAGARAVVAPVAAVNQQATADFMAVFHRALADGMAPAFALRHARRTLAAADNYAHPHYWGSFALFGGIPAAAGSPRQRPARFSPTWLVVAALLLGGGVLLLPRQQRRVGLR